MLVVMTFNTADGKLFIKAERWCLRRLKGDDVIVGGKMTLLAEQTPSSTATRTTTRSL